MKKSGKSGGKGIIPLPPGRFFLLTLLFTLLAAAGVRAQNPPVSINAKAITINELFIRIEKQGVYTFAYNNADIDLKRIVTVHAKERPIESIVRECLPEVNVQVSNNKVILTGRRSDQSSMPMHKLTGTVTDENGAPVTGATVIVVGTQRGTTTSATGAYTLQVRNGEILEFQYLGYEKQAVSVGGQTTLDVTLQPSKAMAVDEVVVIGYGTVKKGDATGSVANIKISDVKDLPVLSVDQALQGRVAGADIMSTTGEPGATTSIRIRGTRSISASNEPLIVVDGVMDAVSDLNDLNMADIESVTILKDASSTAIYGSRGSNGVIIVTTKGGGNHDQHQTFDHAQGRHRILAAAPQARRDECHGVRTLPQRLRLLQHPERLRGHRRGHAPVEISLQSPLLAGQRHRLDRRNHPHGTLPELFALDFGPLEKEQLLRLAGLQRFAGYHRQQRSAAHHGRV